MSFMHFIPILLLLLTSIAEEISGDEECSQKFKTKGYIPQFADILKSTDLQVEYAGKNISCGDIVNLVQAVNAPTLYYNAPSCCRNITVLAVSPDATVTPPFITWLILNIPPDNLRKGFTAPLIGNTDNNGFSAGDYVIPIDPTGGTVADQTLIFFVYCQCGYISEKTQYLKVLRGPFDVKGYAKSKRLGNPMAGFYHKFSATGLDITSLTKGVVPKLSI